MRNSTRILCTKRGKPQPQNKVTDDEETKFTSK